MSEISGPPPTWVGSPRTSTFATGLAVVDAVGVLVGAPTAVAALVRQRPAAVPIVLIVPAVLLIVVGEVLVVLALRRDRSRGRRTTRELCGAAFGALPRTVRIGVLVGLLVLWLVAMSALPWMGEGGPGNSASGCPYVLDNHGTYTCVSHAAYLHAGAAVQRFAAGLASAFLLFHAAATWNLRTRARRTATGGEVMPR